MGACTAALARALPDRRKNRLHLVSVGGFGGLLQIVVRLIQQGPDFSCVAPQIELIGLLGGRNFGEGLRGEALRGGQTRMSGGGNIFPGGRLLSNGISAGAESRAMTAARIRFLSIADIILVLWFKPLRSKQ